MSDVNSTIWKGIGIVSAIALTAFITYQLAKEQPLPDAVKSSVEKIGKIKIDPQTN